MRKREINSVESQFARFDKRATIQVQRNARGMVMFLNRNDMPLFGTTDS